MKLDTAFRWIVVPGVIVAVALHAYTCFIVPEDGPTLFSAGLFAFSILPYLACLTAAQGALRWQGMAACVIPPMLLLDSLAFYEAIIAPTSSTASLVLLVVPIINLGILLLGFLIGWIAFTLFARRATGKSDGA